MNVLRNTVIASSFFGLLALAQPALADGSGSASARQDGKQDLVGQAERWLTQAAAGPTAASDPRSTGSAREGASTAERSAELVSAAGGDKKKPLFALTAPATSVVARDWHGSLRIMGDHTLVLDDLRATASNRMVLARIATDSRISTFAQMGAGEWRIDPAMFPTARSYSEIAGQAGAGVELQLSSSMRIASEATYTALYRGLHYTSDEVAPRILAFAVAIDGRF